MRTTLAAATLILATLAASASAAAGPGSPPRWTLRLQGIAADRPAGLSFALIDTAIDVGYDTGFGIGASLEYRLSDRLGIDLSTSVVEHGVEVAAVGPRSTLAVGVGLELIPSTLGLVVHLTPRRKADLYLLAGIGVVLVNPGPRAFSDDIVTGGLGLDVSLADKAWALTSSLRFFDASAGSSLDTGPLLTLGVARRF